MPNYAIGSCYIVKQMPGAERMGGVEVRVRPKSGDVGKLEVDRTDWRTGEVLCDLAELQVEEAVAGVRSLAAEINFPLDDFDITIHRFINHPVDWNPKCVRQAGRSAFRAALEGFQVQDL